MLDHKENFELESEYNEIWDKIRYKKVDELYELTQEVVGLLDNHIDDKLLFHGDYDKIQNLFKKMRQKNFFLYVKNCKRDCKVCKSKI